jgi:hypothetical protein
MSQPVRYFTAKDRAAVLSAVVYEPSGVIFEVGGMSFNLLAMPVKRMLHFFRDGATTEGGTFDQVQATYDFVHEMLAKSAMAQQQKDGVDFDPVTFSEWFAEVSTPSLLQEAAKKIVEASGVVAKDPPTPAPTTEKKPAKRTLSTPSVAS